MKAYEKANGQRDCTEFFLPVILCSQCDKISHCFDKRLACLRRFLKKVGSKPLGVNYWRLGCIEIKL